MAEFIVFDSRKVKVTAWVTHWRTHDNSREQNNIKLVIIKSMAPAQGLRLLAEHNKHTKNQKLMRCQSNMNLYKTDRQTDRRVWLAPDWHIFSRDVKSARKNIENYHN